MKGLAGEQKDCAVDEALEGKWRVKRHGADKGYAAPTTVLPFYV
jgi:hypothetical protein